MNYIIDRRGRKLSDYARSKMGGKTRFRPIHGMRNSPEYKTWQDMLNRCRNPKQTSYKNYGARGISVCKRWYKFKNFFSDLGKKPSPNKDYSIERIDVNKNYTPGNVIWLLKRFQARNQTRTKKIKYRGENLSISEWSERTGIKRDTLYSRVFRRKWSIERSILT